MATMKELTDAAVLRLRMESLLLGTRRLDSPLEIVTWFGAMQAQDLASGKWSFGVRLPGSTERDIDAAIESGEVLRTWPMRGTIHFVPPADATWMLAHTGEKALAGAAARREYLGLDLATVDKAADILQTALRGGKRLTRSEAVQVLNDNGIATAGQHSYHIIWYVSQIGITCIGPNEGKEQTIVLLDEWAGPQRSFERRQGLAELALRYFRSHGPTSHQDFMGWAGITAKEAKGAIADNEPNLVSAPFQGSEYWMLASLPDSVSTRSGVATVALPGFDEYLLGFKDRTLMLAADHKHKIIPGNNGVFQSTIVDAGRAIGIWKRAVKKTKVDITTAPFEPPTSAQRTRIERAFTQYGKYVGLPVSFR
jgi:Winged helix DNA-binding domain